MLAKEIVRDVHHDEKRKGAQNESSFFSSSALLRAQSDRFRVHFVLLLVITTTTEGGGGGGGKHHLLKLFSLILCDDELFFGLKKKCFTAKTREEKATHRQTDRERERKEKNIFFRFCLLHALNKLIFTIFFFFRIYYTLKAHTDSNYIYINKTQKKDDFEREICEEQQREEEF